MSRKKIRVGVIFGGKSGEHEVSLTSAKNVMGAMDPDKYEIVPIGISKSGLWLTGEKVAAYLAAGSKVPPRLQAEIEAAEETSSLVPFLDKSLVDSTDLGQLDVIFPILHGPMGEDGTVQGLLELADLPYVGCGVTGSAVAMDKTIAKAIFQANDLPIVPHRVVLRRTWQASPDQVIAELEASLTYPMFTKPANLGSSVGISKAKDRAGLRAGLDEAARYDRKLLIEQGVDAREIEVSVLGNDAPIASLPGEVVPSREFYSYAAKYIDDDSRLLIPAPLSPALTDQIRALAIKAFQVLDGAGLARVDFLLDKANDDIFINEVNTRPGFTAISMYPKLWEASGLSHPELIDRLIELALERYEDKQQTTSEFDVSQAE
jgi:D-alanine-D-alanine ligase